jgi:hypothetical protein
MLYRLWYALGWIVLRALPIGRQTSASIVLRRAFEQDVPHTPYWKEVGQAFGRMVLRVLPKRWVSIALQQAFKRGVTPAIPYRGDYLAVNFLTALVLFCVAYFIYEPVGEGAYILLTYQHNKYTVMVTSHFPDRSAPHQFGVYGYRMLVNGEKRDIFMEIGPSFWFQEYNPENIFAKVRDNTLCEFDGYGFPFRLPLAIRYLSKDSLWALNPWIVDVRCKDPVIDNSTKN